MTNETKNEWLMREHLERLVFAIGPMRATTDVVESARAALPDLVLRDKWRAERVVAESLRTRVAEMEAANRKLHARRFAVCDTLGLLARDENGEILNDPELEDVIGAIEELQGRAERRAPSVAPAAPVEASEAQPDYWMRVKIEHASRELARMESFREQDIDAAFRIAATFTAAARSAKGGSGQ